MVEWNGSTVGSNVALDYISIKCVGLRKLQFRDQRRGMLCAYQNIWKQNEIRKKRNGSFQFQGTTAMRFKVCKSVHYHTIQMNQPTRSNNFSSFLLDVYVQFNIFRASSRPLSGAQHLR
jgi:hypothetical protein